MRPAPPRIAISLTPFSPPIPDRACAAINRILDLVEAEIRTIIGIAP